MSEIIKAPICFTPYLKSVIWGGNKICKFKNIEQTVDNIGESWEISAVPGHVSVVECGEYAGLTLNELIERFGVELLGDRVYAKYGAKFPLLIKLIDANENLSVQVHPDDKLAMARHNSLGKTEMWYIISTDKDAKIYAGLESQITPEIYEEKVADGTFADVLATHISNVGDVFYLPAGRVHAIGAGNLLAEIQESSDVTYRIFDYNRRDANGNTRELHTALAKDAIDYAVRADYKSEAPSDAVKDAEIVSCEHFNVRRIIVEGTIALNLDPTSFAVVICIDGEITLKYESDEMKLHEGHTALIPAILTELEIEGDGKIIMAQA